MQSTAPDRQDDEPPARGLRMLWEMWMRAADWLGARRPTTLVWGSCVLAAAVVAVADLLSRS